MTDMNNPETIEIHGLRTIHKLCKFGADNNMEGCSFTEIVHRLFMELEKAKAQAVPKWISVKDGLPSYEESVLIKTNKGSVQGYLFQDEEYSEMKGEYLKYDSWQDDFHDDFIEYEDVTHWMPLPKTPSESGAEQ
ncbi:DUF551 domain-containing protein [Acinetobacter baumannii]|nr:DUF551 domain-containing protein [Acinetobacter baumannii]